MGITAGGQAGLFLLSCLVGLTLGIIYDVFRIARVAARCSAAAIFLQDVIFWLICAAVTFAFLVIANSGKPRAFVIMGEFCGAVIWYVTIGNIAVRKIKAADQSIKRHVKAAAVAAADPVIKFGHQFSVKVTDGGRKTKSYLKKETKIFKLRLKVHQKMLYNQLRSTKRQKKRRVRKRVKNQQYFIANMSLKFGGVKMKKKRRSILLRLAVCVFALFIAVTLFSQMTQIKKQHEQLADVKSQVNQTENRIADIKRVLSENDQQFMESVARNDLDYAKPNERIYVDASGN